MSAADNGLADSGAATEASFNELREKLSDLREHLKQMTAALNEQREGGRRSERAGDGRDLRCYTCGRTRPKEQTGWTLRLCGDDELHPFCPDCDRRHVSADGEDRRTEMDAAPAG